MNYIDPFPAGHSAAPDWTRVYVCLCHGDVSRLPRRVVCFAVSIESGSTLDQPIRLISLCSLTRPLTSAGNRRARTHIPAWSTVRDRSLLGRGYLEYFGEYRHLRRHDSSTCSEMCIGIHVYLSVPSNVGGSHRALPVATSSRYFNYRSKFIENRANSNSESSYDRDKEALPTSCSINFSITYLQLSILLFLQ